MISLGVDGLFFDSNRLEIVENDRISKLDPRIAELLAYFIAHPNRVISRDELISSVWDSQFISDDAINRSISVLRKALGDQGRKRLVTVPKVGYRFELAETQTSANQIQPAFSSASESGRPAWHWLMLVTLIVFGAVITYFGTKVQAKSAPRIAVLPFTHVDANNQHFLTQGLSGEIISALSQSQTFQVIAERSSQSFANGQTSLNDIAAKLQADIVIDGKVQKLQDSLRISIEVIEVDSGTNLWAKQFAFSDSAFAEKQLYQLTHSVYAFLHQKYQGKDDQLADFEGTENQQAYRAFLQGKQALNERNTASLAEAESAFKRAITLDPDYLKAKAYLYFTYWYSVEQLGTSYKQLYPQLAPLYREFVASSSTLPEVYAAKGLYMVFEGNFELAQSLTQQAVDLSPSNTLYIDQLALIHSYQGNVAASVALLEKAILLNPEVLSSRAKLIKLHRDSGNLDRAFELLNEMMSLDKYNGLTANALLSLNYSINKDLKSSIEYLNSINVEQNAKLLNQAAQLYLLAGNIDRALELAHIRTQQAPLDFNLHLTLASIYLDSTLREWAPVQQQKLANIWQLMPRDYAALVKSIGKVTGGDYQTYMTEVIDNPLIIREMDNFFFRRSTASTGLYILGILSLYYGDTDTAKLVFDGSQWLYDYCIAEQFLYMCPSVLYLSQQHSNLDIMRFAIKAKPRGLEYEYSIGREQYLATDPFFIMLHDNLLYQQFVNNLKSELGESVAEVHRHNVEATSVTEAIGATTDAAN